MEELQEQFDSLSYEEKRRFFARNYACYLREGEWLSLYEDAPEEVKAAFAKFQNESSSMVK